MLSVAIIGAGCSGLAAAHTLLDAGYNVTLFEKSRSVGGRVATRKQAGFIYDHGAQYIKRGNSDSVALITERFRAPDLIDIDKPVWIFDRDGNIQEGDPAQNAEPKWSYRSGLTALIQQMAHGLDIRLETHVSHIQQTTRGWELSAERYIGNFDCLLISIPAPQAIDLLQASTLDQSIQTAACSQLSTAHYNPLLSIMLGYRPQPSTRPYYALVNTDKAHAISWLAWEHEKAPERAPTGTGLLVAQMAPQYSREHWQTADTELVQDAAQYIVALTGEQLPTPFFIDIERWHYALPATKANIDSLNPITLPLGLAFCGDAFVGGRIHLALENGIMVARQLISSRELA